MCFLIFFSVIITGFWVVDKSFNTMLKSEESIKIVSLNLNEKGLLEGNLFNEYFSVNVSSVLKNIEKVKNTVVVYVEKIGNSNMKNVI